MACSSSQLSILPGAEKKRSKQKLEVLYCYKDSEVLIDPYVINESKLNDGIVALWPPVKLGQIYTYFSKMPGQFTRAKMKFLQELRCLNLIII